MLHYSDHPISYSCIKATLRPCASNSLVLSNQGAHVSRVGGDGARPQNTVFLNFSVPDGRCSRHSKPAPESTGMLSHVGNLLVLIKLENVMEKYCIPFYAVDRLTGELYLMKVNTMTQTPEKATVMPKLSSTIRMCPLDPYQRFSPSGMWPDQHPQWSSQLGCCNLSCQSQLMRMKRGAVGFTPFIVAWYSSSCNSGFTNIDLIHKILDEESRWKSLGKSKTKKTN